MQQPLTCPCAARGAVGQRRWCEAPADSLTVSLGRLPARVGRLVLRGQPARRVGVLQRDERVDEVDERPEVLLRKRPLPGGHRGAPDARGDHPVQILPPVVGAHRPQLGAREVRREQLHPVVTVREHRMIQVRPEVHGAGAGQLLRRRVDLRLRGVGGVAREALGEPVVELPAARDAFCLAALPRIRRRQDGLPGLFLLPARREGLHVLDDLPDLVLGDAVPRQHGGPVQAAPDDALQVLVVRERAALDGGELEHSQGEVARRRAQPLRGRSLAVPLVAMTGTAVLDVGARTRGEHLRWNDLAAELLRLLEARRPVSLAGGHAAGEEQDDRAHHGDLTSRKVDGQVQRPPYRAHEVPVPAPEPHVRPGRGPGAGAEREPRQRRQTDEHVEGVERGERVEDRRVRTAARDEPLAPEADPDHGLQRQEDRAQDGRDREGDGRAPAARELLRADGSRHRRRSRRR